jgi:hypothetical protein
MVSSRQNSLQGQPAEIKRARIAPLYRRASSSCFALPELVEIPRPRHRHGACSLIGVHAGPTS